MQEIWQDIEGFESKYQVSTEGNIRSLNYNNTGKPRNLKIKVNKHGFCEVSLSKDNKKKDFMVARLVAEAFIPNPYNKPKVTHINNDKENNKADNLKWVYDSESKFMMYQKGNRKIGKPSGNVIGFKGKRYKRYSDLARANNLLPSQLFKRLERGWSLQEALTIPISRSNTCRNAKKHEYYDEEITIKELSKRIGITPKQIHKRLENRWSIYECEIPMSVHKKKEEKQCK